MLEAIGRALKSGSWTNEAFIALIDLEAKIKNLSEYLDQQKSAKKYFVFKRSMNDCLSLLTK